MSSTNASTDSRIDTDHIDADGSLDQLKFVGKRRAHKLPYGSVRSLAETDAETLYESDSIAVTKSEAEKIMSQATNAVSETADASTVDEDDMPDKYIPDDATSETGGNEPETVAVDDLDPEPSEPQPQISDDDVTKIGLVVGMDGRGGSVLADADDTEIGNTFMQALETAGLDASGDGWTPVMLRSDMGVSPIVTYLKAATNHDEVLREQVHEPAGSNPSSDEWRQAYEARDERFIDAIDGLVVIANGDFVGQYVSAAADENKAIWTPPQDEGDFGAGVGDVDGLEVKDASE